MYRSIKPDNLFMTMSNLPRSIRRLHTLTNISEQDVLMITRDIVFP